ncbi:MAG: M55 family metallopeptidase [Bacteroidota bacterium]
MQVYIMADMEGIGGIVLREQVTKGTPEYAEARQLFIEEVNAAVAGAFEGGATRVIVRDGHGSGFNFPPEKMDPRAEWVQGSTPAGQRFPGMGEETDLLLLVGYHAMAGTAAAVRDHTMSSTTWQRFELNGQEVGEVGIDAAFAGYLGVPVGLVTGDDMVCREARELLGDVETAEVKQALARHGALMLAPLTSRKLVREAAARAVARAHSFTPFVVEPPVVVRIRYTGTEMVDSIRTDGRRKIRLDGQTVEFRGDNLWEVLSMALWG